MAKQVSEILIKLGLEGVQGLDKLKGAFRELEKSIGPNNAAIERARQSIIDYGRDSRNTEQVIKGQIDALRGLQSQVERGSSTWAQLAADIEQFRQASRRTDGEIETLRQGILSISAGTNQSQASLRAYIVDLGKLRSEASLTGSTFTDLGSDIAALTARLAQAEAQTVQTSRAFGRVLGQALASTSAGARKQLQDLQLLIAEQRQAIDTIDTLSQRERRLTQNIEARADAQDRLNRSLAQQRQLTYQESIRGNREAVRAGAAAFNDPTFLTPEGVNRRFGELPNTTAALSQELNELSERLANTVRGSTAYVDVSNRIADVQRELRRELTGTAEAFERLGRAQAASERRGGKVAGIQEYYSTQGPLAPGVGGYRDPATGAMIARGARTPDRIRVDEAAYAQPIGPQPLPSGYRQAEQALQQSLDRMGEIYNQHQVQRAEIQARYRQIELDKEAAYNDTWQRAQEKQFQDDLDLFDRQLEARDRKRRGRLTAGQAVQAGGAVISGGIFGGPEGFLGGLGGAAIGSAIPGLGTVGGAFAGAAIGAQVGMVRQQLGATAEYAASLEKLRIALRNVTGSSTEYNQALVAIRTYSQELAIPQDVITKSFTQLTASVLGAGGTVKDADVAFRGIAAGIRGTGGSIENLNAAVLATSQVFSKGKVSAEELRGQIGERLPGAFSLFAASIGKTPQELDKALEQGQVSLNDFQKFAEELFKRYGDSAKEIADGPAAAGDRLKTALSNLSESVGTLLRPVGAQFQSTFAVIVQAIDNGIRKLNEFLGVGRQGEINEAQKNLDATENRLKQYRDALADKPGMGMTRDLTVQVAQLEARRGQQFSRLQALLAADMTARGAGTDTVQRPGLPGPTADTSKAGKERESLMRKLQRDFDGTITQLGREFNSAAKDKLYETLLEYEAKIQSAYAKNNRVLAEDLKLKQKAAALDLTQDVLLSEKAALQQKLSEAAAKGLEAQGVQNRLDAVNAELKQLQYESSQAVTAELDKQSQKATQIRDALQQVFAPTVADSGPINIGGASAGFAFGEEESFKGLTDQRGIERIKELNKELQTLIDPLSQILTAAEAIGTTFSSSFTSVINGTATTQEALASFFNNIANYFLDMAGKIIAKWIEMAILNTVLQLLPSGPKFGTSAAVPGLPGLSGAGALSGGASIAGSTDWASQAGGFFSGFKMNAKGNAYAQNGIVPFAMGGIVNKPTMFKFANGGAGNLGLMGEAGPEAIIPLKRGSDGKLGVSGGGGTNVVVNVDASGSQVQGDDNRGQQLGRAVAAAVQQELIKQKRPGGLLP